MGPTQITLDINMTNQRDSEAIVAITLPKNHSYYNSTESFNVTAIITITGNNGINCNATLSFSVPGIFALATGETYIHNLGNINRGDSVTEVWNLTGFGTGDTNITVFAECQSDGLNLEDKNTDTIYNITSQDVSPPDVTIISPKNNTRLNNLALFYYTISAGSPIKNCTLEINSVLTNTTIEPLRNSILNFSYTLTQKTNLWEINCTSNTTGKIGSTGIFNLTLNSYPTITNINIENPISLIGGSTKKVWCNGSVRDLDSYTDIYAINASLFFQNVTPNHNNNEEMHYSNSSCALFNGAADDIDFSCSFDVEYYANNGTWYCNITVVDSLNSTNSSQQPTYINDLLAIGISPSIISFGGLEPLQISPYDTPINITNYGNVKLDTQLYAYALNVDDNVSMVCTIGNITYDYERVSLLQDQNFNLMTPVNNSLNRVYLDLNVSKRSAGSPESKKQVYWKLQIPLETAGSCNGKVVFGAIIG